MSLERDLTLNTLDLIREKLEQRLNRASSNCTISQERGTCANLCIVVYPPWRRGGVYKGVVQGRPAAPLAQVGSGWAGVQLGLLPPFLLGGGGLGGRSPTPPPNPSWGRGGTPPSLPWPAGPRGRALPLPQAPHPLLPTIYIYLPLPPFGRHTIVSKSFSLFIGIVLLSNKF